MPVLQKSQYRTGFDDVQQSKSTCNIGLDTIHHEWLGAKMVVLDSLSTPF